MRGGRVSSQGLRALTKDHIQYKAFDDSSTRYYFVPIGRDGLPLIVNTEPAGRPMP